MNDLLSKLEGQGWECWWGSCFLLALALGHYTNWTAAKYGKRTHVSGLLQQEGPRYGWSQLCLLFVKLTQVCVKTCTSRKPQHHSRHPRPFLCTADVAEVMEVPAGVFLLYMCTCLVSSARPTAQLWVVLPSNGGCQNWRSRLISCPWPWSSLVSTISTKSTKTR